MNLGQVVQTATVAAEVNPSFRAFVNICYQKHSNGDFGDLDAHDKALNKAAYEANKITSRVMSSYNIPEPIREVMSDNSDKLWIITYPTDNTTVLFPHEY